ncbi:DUF2868 domain-containing protein [Pseudomonas sp. TE3786]
MPPTNSPASLLSPLHRLWLTEAIRLREEQAGPLEDREANRLAVAEGGDLASRIERRALWLAQRDGLLAALQHWRQGAQLALGLLLVLALLSGAGLGLAALGDGQRPVNVFWALGSLLGLHLIMLVGWAVSLVLGGGNASLGRLWLWLSEKLARDAQAAQLAPALLVLLQRERLGRWAIGMLVHGLWLLVMLSALGSLLALLATRRYGFVWETTLLGSDTFVSLTQTLGALPHLLGFSTPAVELIRASGADAVAEESARQAWAIWLLGLLVCYGILPRALLALLCAWRWRRGRTKLRLDLEQPGYSLLREHLQPSSERLGITDAAPAQLSTAQAGGPAANSEGALLVAVELDPQRPWPPTLPKGVADAGVIDSREQRQHLLDQLSRFPPARLAIACDPRRSPDRGTLALLAELARNAGATRIWLLAAEPGEAVDSQRLGDWHSALDDLHLHWRQGAPLAWLENGHE